MTTDNGMTLEVPMPELPPHDVQAVLAEQQRQTFPIGSFCTDSYGEVWQVADVFDGSGRHLVNAVGEIGMARIWNLTATDEEF